MWQMGSQTMIGPRGSSVTLCKAPILTESKCRHGHVKKNYWKKKHLTRQSKMRWVKYGGHRRLGVDDQWRVAKWKAHPYVWRLRRRKTRQILRFKKRSRHRNQTDENLDQLWWTRGRKLKECVGKKSWGPACWRLAATGFAFNGQSTNASVLTCSLHCPLEQP